VRMCGCADVRIEVPNREKAKGQMSKCANVRICECGRTIGKKNHKTHEGENHKEAQRKNHKEARRGNHKEAQRPLW